MEKNTPSNNLNSEIKEEVELTPLEKLAEKHSELQAGTFTPPHKVTYQHGFIDGYNSATATPSNTPVEEKDALLEKANKEYPIGTIRKSLITREPLPRTGKIFIDKTGDVRDDSGYICYWGIWAEIISTPVHEAKDLNSEDAAGKLFTRQDMEDAIWDWLGETEPQGKGYYDKKIGEYLDRQVNKKNQSAKPTNQ